jgi:putative membrane protein
MKNSTNRKSEIDRQREHQANERTFLAWLRTAIARFGLFLRQLQTAVTQQPTVADRNLVSSENLGVSLVIVGIFTIALAAWRYNRVFGQIESGNYRPNRLVIWLLAVIMMALGTMSIPLILGRSAPSPPTSERDRN